MAKSRLNRRNRAKKRPSGRPGRHRFESLEPRQMMAGDFRPLDGVGNNLLNPEWGSTEEAFLRTAPAEYADGLNSPAGADRPSPREISNLLAAHPAEEISNDRDLSAFIYAWGQFVDHDIDLTLSSTSPDEAAPIDVPAGDPWFDPQGTGDQTIDFMRSLFTADAEGVRQQVNHITAFIDGSQIYGSDAETALSLRTLVGGRLKTSEGNQLPVDETGNFVAGDIRVNENPDLIALQTLFVREHNRLADDMAAKNSGWDDERIYQEARRVVVAEVQAITYREFLPALLGRGAIPAYHGYQADVNPGIANEFAAAAYRLGHSMLGPDVEFLDNDGNPVHDAVELRNAFFNPALVQETGIDPILKYLASDHAEEIDTRVVDDVRNFLFGPPGAGGFDLASLNIQRGRDHGLADYNTVRVAYGLQPVSDFSQITSNAETAAALQEAYGSVDNIDLWVGGLAEDHAPGASVGPLFQRILVDQFTRLRDGDRFWYERDLPRQLVDQVNATTLADVIARNTTTTNLQRNVFFFEPTVSGQVFADGNANGALDRREVGLQGVRLELIDGEGNVVARSTTAPDGHFRLEAPGLGDYTVRIVAPDVRRTTPLEAFAITSGDGPNHVLIGLQSARLPTAPPRDTRPQPAGNHKPTPTMPQNAPRRTPVAPPARRERPAPKASITDHNATSPDPMSPQAVDLLFGSVAGDGAGSRRRR